MANKPGMCNSCDKDNHFIYQPARRPPSLRRLPKPPPQRLPDDHFGLLPRRGGEHFAVAALHRGSLHVFNSETWAWTSSSNVPVLAPRRPFPIPISSPRTAAQAQALLYHHFTSTVITLGGDSMGWVDLYLGILLCDDVLSSNPTLRDVPLPPPQSDRGGENESCPELYRSIAAVQGQLRLVELEIHGDMGPKHDPETGDIDFTVHDWELDLHLHQQQDHWCSGGLGPRPLKPPPVLSCSRPG